MNIVIVQSLENTPAKTNRKTKTIYISKVHFDKLDEVSQGLIINHEIGHVLLDTHNEQLCDDYAVQVLLKQGYSLNEILKAIVQTLGKKNTFYGRKMNILNALRVQAALNN